MLIVETSCLKHIEEYLTVLLLTPFISYIYKRVNLVTIACRRCLAQRTYDIPKPVRFERE